MALIEKFMVVAAEKPVASSATIKEGVIVSLNASGEVVLPSAQFPIPYGIAGDTKSTSASAMPGVQSGWQNRVSDYFDETKASGKITVYHSGGEFATDQFVANVANVAIGAPLYANLTTGQLDDQVTASGIVARLIKAAGAYPSGVPGTDINGDQAVSGDNSNTYIEIKLVI